MGFKKWQIAKGNIELAKLLSFECELDQFLTLLAVNRGMDETYLLDEFFDDNPSFDDPFLMLDMKSAVERILLAVNSGEKIAIFGDYDCDGVTSTALLYMALIKLNANVIYYIPDRILEGYGMNMSAIDCLKDEGVELIVTVDNGINANIEIEYAKSLGIDTVVTDHHLPQGQLPNAVAVVDPHRLDETVDYKYLSGVGVAFKLVCALNYTTPIEKLLEEYAHLVAIGTIGDVVPLIKENRSIVKQGLHIINESDFKGVNALIENASSKARVSTSQNISFMIVPRINAAGRMGDSKRAVKLLTTTDETEAKLIADELERDNQLRQQLCEEVYSQAIEKIESQKLYKNDIIVCFGDGWHAGIIGIVAARIVERYSKPAILFTKQDDILHGSGRSIEGCNLFDAISFASAKTEVFGGHELAAGVTIKAENYNDFYKMLLQYFEGKEPIIPTLTIDCNLRAEIINTQLFDLLLELEPYGAGNNVPIFALNDATILNITPLKDGKYTKLLVGKNNCRFTALCFNIAYDEFMYSQGSKIDIAFALDCNEYMGTRHINLIVKAVRPSDFNDEKFFGSLFSYKRLKNNTALSTDFDVLYPNRDDFKRVYSLLLNSTKPLEREQIDCRLHTLGVGKISIILDAFLEFRLISEEGTKYSALKNTNKVDILSANIIKKLENIKKAGD